MFIVLEGPDATGKSTACRKLGEKFGGVMYSTPPKKYLAERNNVDANASAEEHYRFYRDGVYDASKERASDAE
jgi:nicotinamide riboside kinase